MWKIELEEEILKEMLSNWEAFLFFKDIYWPLHLKQKDLPAQYKNIQLTAGRLLISIELLSNYSKDDNQNSLSSKDNISQVTEMIDKWRANWEKKILKEIPVRVRHWQQIVNDIKTDRAYTNAQLKNDTQVRLMINLLLDQLDEDKRLEFEMLLEPFDQRFRSLTTTNEFILNEEFAEFFPTDQYWFLYRKMQQPGG